MKNTKRILSVLLCLVMILGIIPVIASAEGETYTKVATDEITSGQYVLINDAGYAVGAYDGSWLAAKKITVTDGTVAAADAAGYVYTLTVDGTSVKLQDPNGKYVAPKSGNNNGIQNTEYSWSMSISDKGVQFKGTGSDTTTLASNSGSSYKFRAYKNTTVSGNAKSYPSYFTLYKLDEAQGGEGGDTPACEHTNLGEAIHVDGKHVAECECGELITSKDYVVSVAYDDAEHKEVCTCGYEGTAAAHNMSDWTVKTPATAAAPGVEIKTCSGCAYTESQEIPQLAVTGNHYIKYSNATLLSGTYILVAGEYALGKFENGWILNTQAPVIDENTVADDMGGVWTLTVTDAGVILTDANGVTVSPKAGNNNGILAADYVWGWAYDETTGTYSFTGVGSDTTTLALNKAEGKFRAYKNTTLSGSYAKDYEGKFVLYKLEGEQSCAHETAYTTTETTHIAYCSKCQEVFIEETWHDLKGENGTCSVCGYAVDADVLTAAVLEKVFALAAGEKLEGNFMLTGKITAINYTFDTSYKNMSVTIAIEGYDQTIYCYRMKCTADQAAALYVGAVITVEGPFENYGGTFELNGGTLIAIAPCEHEYDNDCDADCNVCGATRDAGHVYDDNCDFDCNVCEELRAAPHNLGESVPAVIPANCQETGHNEYWICQDCGCYFMSDGMGGYYETNPAWINYAGEHVRPEGTPGCAVVACEVCGEDSYGTESCDRGTAPACQDATCVNCGGTVYGEGHSYGYDEETWESLIPFCQAGDCIYCGEHLDYIYECENGSYAPCSVDGECVYGCGKQFPATGVHALDNPCEGGLCWQCWEEIEGAHNYVDGTCTNCGETQGPAIDENLNFYAPAGLSFQDYIGVQIFFQNATGMNYDRVYAIAVQADPAGDITTELGSFAYGTAYTVFEHKVMAWSMTEGITITLYGEKDGKVYQGQVIETSVEALTLAKIADYASKNNTKACTALVDLLNYGAAVQVAQNHNADNIPSAGEYASFATAADPEFNATNSITGSGVQAAVNNISMQAKVEIQLMFKTSDMEGKTFKATVNGAEVAVEYTPYSSYTICRVAVAASQMRDTFTIALYDADGNAVSAVYEVSVEAYGQAQLNGAKAELVKAMMKYGDAVAAL